MSTDPADLGLVLAGLVFTGFIVFRALRPPGARDPEWHEAKRKIADAKRRARDRSSGPQERAAALRDAAQHALEGLARPSLAASYARRAERLDPADGKAVSLMAVSLRRARRFGALERLLWRRLAQDPDPKGAGYERAYQELLSLYEGPMRRPETAEGLRRLRAGS